MGPPKRGDPYVGAPIWPSVLRPPIPLDPALPPIPPRPCLGGALTIARLLMTRLVFMLVLFVLLVLEHRLVVLVVDLVDLVGLVLRVVFLSDTLLVLGQLLLVASLVVRSFFLVVLLGRTTAILHFLSCLMMNLDAFTKTKRCRLSVPDYSGGQRGPMPRTPRSPKKHGKGGPLYFGPPKHSLRGPQKGDSFMGPLGATKASGPRPPHDPALSVINQKFDDLHFVQLVLLDTQCAVVLD
jgi:hypothetical protein